MVEGVVLAAWFLPALFAVMMVVGYVHSHKLQTGHSTELIIQVTTIGNQESVNGIISAIRGFDLPFPFKIWVVVEPKSPDGYVGADEVIVVPQDFHCRASYKARALEYSRRLRSFLGLTRPDIKILYVDDDSLPTRSYIVKAFWADYDICQGITAPRTSYGRFLSHLDDLRTLNCIMFCSVFQGFGQPMFVHGEGLCVRASAEQLVTWDYPMFASEDFVFGQMAAKKGLRWGFFYDYINIVSPWSFGDYVKQRRRWTWGNIHAVIHLVPFKAKVLIVGKHLLGIESFAVSTAALPMDFLGMLDIPTQLRYPLYATALLWLGSFAMSGWINSGGKKRHALISVLLAWVVSAINVLVFLLAVAMGNPRRFEVIRKTEGAEKVSPATRKPVALAMVFLFILASALATFGSRKG